MVDDVNPALPHNNEYIYIYIYIYYIVPVVEGSLRQCYGFIVSSTVEVVQGVI